MSKFTLHQGDSLEVMKTISSDSIDAVISDPPYGLKFMGKDWDNGIPGKAYWEEALRIAKPGTHILAFGGTRTFHRLTVAIEDAGWEIRDVLSWNYLNGFPKSHDISKAIDKEAGIWRGRQTELESENSSMSGANYKRVDKGNPITDDAKYWTGWGTALKPSWEPIILARKPITQTIVSNILEHGTGGLNIDDCRIETTDNLNGGAYAIEGTSRDDGWGMQRGKAGEYEQPMGRWPANTIFDEEAGKMFGKEYRFFYCPKVSQQEANAGLDSKNSHPTKKPIALMRWLVKLITPKNGIVIDPFMGSGSTGCATLLEGHEFIGIDLEQEYVDIARHRMEHYEEEREQEETAHEFFSFGEE